MHASRWIILAALALGCLPPAASFAEPPTVEWLFPAGAQQGSATQITAGGTFSDWPIDVWVDREGLDVTCAEDKGKLQITVDAGAEPGVYWLRLHSPAGASALRPFVVGILPAYLEQEYNNGPSAANEVSLPVVANGRLEKRNDVDSFAVALERGQTLVACVQANRVLDAPMDTVLQVADQAGFVLAQNDDRHGLDSAIVYQAPRAGTYLVRLFAFPETPTSTIGFAGSENFIYRLTLTTGGYVDHALPLAVQRGVATPIQLAGWNLPDGREPLILTPPADSESVVAWSSQAAGAVELPVQDHPSLTVVHHAEALETDIELPVTITGRLAEVGSFGRFAFQARKGEQLRFAIASESLGYETDAVLSLRDGMGKLLKSEDDTNRQPDPTLDFTMPEDGRYQLELRDLHGRGGLRFVYRLIAQEIVPNYELELATERLSVARGGTVELTINVRRRDGFNQAIEVQAIDLPPGVAGQVGTAAAREPAQENRRRRGSDRAGESVTLKLTASQNASSGTFRIRGTAAGRADRVATFAVADGAAEHTAAWLTVVE